MTDQTTAGILNAAIQRIRDAVDSAANNHLDDELCCWDHERIAGHERVIEIRAMPDGNDEDVIAVPTTSGVAEHIALWDPTAAHLVADLLEQIAKCDGVKNMAVMRVVNSAAALAKGLGGDREHYNAGVHNVSKGLHSEDAADLALVQVRAVADNGNRTPLADVLTKYGMTEDDMEASD